MEHGIGEAGDDDAMALASHRTQARSNDDSFGPQNRLPPSTVVVVDDELVMA